ncbi:MAG: hypothetical protein KDK76_06385 [Chlamydiia bacterium]|nr:hypothetical protein [Chlamydiia bacterium]
MEPIKNKNLQSLLPPALMVGAAFLAGSSRLIQFFPGASRKGLLISSTLAASVHVGAGRLFHGDQTKRRGAYVGGLLLATLATPTIAKTLLGRADINLKGAALFGLLQGAITAGGEYFSSKPSSSTPPPSPNTTPETTPTPTPEPSPQARCFIVPASDEDSRAYQTLKEEWSRKMAAALRADARPLAEIERLSPEIKAVFNNRASGSRGGCPEGLTYVQSGVHVCFFYTETPTLVYKAKMGTGYTQETANGYVKQADRARALCQEKGLNLLYVPQSIAVETENGRYIIVQEKVNVNADYDYQKGLYSYLIHSPDTEEYAKELHRQLAVFIGEFGFGDVKFDNIPISEDGVVALFDLDERGALMGLTQGGGHGKTDGLLSHLPPAWIDEVVQALPEEGQREVNPHLQVIKERYPAKVEQDQPHQEFLAGAEITLPNQQIVVDPNDFADFTDSEKQVISWLTEEMNRALSRRKDWIDLKGARTFDILYPIQKWQEFNLNINLFRQAMRKGLNELKNRNLICNFNVDGNGYNVSIVC